MKYLNKLAAFVDKLSSHHAAETNLLSHEPVFAENIGNAFQIPYATAIDRESNPLWSLSGQAHVKLRLFILSLNSLYAPD